MKKVIICFLLIIVLDGKLFAGLNINKINFQGQPAYQMENSFVRGIVLPNSGGKIVSISFLKQGKTLSDISLDEEKLFPSVGPFSLQKADFESEIISKGHNEVRLRLWYKVKKEENRLLEGIIVEKLFILNSDSFGFKVEFRLKNESDNTKRPGFVSSHRLGPCKYFIYPSARGPKAFEYGKDFGTKSCESLVSGWCGLIKDAVGIVFIMDYGNISNVRSDVEKGIVQWGYDRVEIPPGQSWNTSVYIILTEGFSSYTFASPDIITDVQLDKEKQIVNRVSNSFNSLAAGIKLKTVVEEWLSHKEIARSAIQLESIPSTSTTLLPKSLDESLLVKSSLEGKGTKIEYERFFQLKELPKNDMPALGAVKVELGYRIIPPLKNKVIPKPEGLKITGDKKILFIKGLYYEHYKIEESIKETENIEVKKSNYKIGQGAGGLFCPSLSYFPQSYEELYKYRVVIMADVDAQCIGDEGRTFLKSFVEAGGGLLLLGGPYTFGAGQMNGTYFDDILPVVIDKTFDLKKGPFPLKKTKETPAWLSFNDEKAVVIWKHDLRLKPEAVVWLTAGDEPFLIASNYGKGRVVICTGTVLGIPPEGMTGFWETKEWEGTVSGITRWLLNEVE